VKSFLINVATDFSRFPSGRYCSDGQYSGQQFRDVILVRALGEYEHVTVMLDGTSGYASSWLEEVFGGVSDYYRIADRLTIVSIDDPSLVDEANEYIKNGINKVLGSRT